VRRHEEGRLPVTRSRLRESFVAMVEADTPQRYGRPPTSVKTAAEAALTRSAVVGEFSDDSFPVDVD
jgi:hypothetical protein